MNYLLLSRLVGIVCLLIGASMVFSLPWSHPALANRTLSAPLPNEEVEWAGVLGLLGSMAICGLLGGGLWSVGRNARGPLYRKEAMAVVGLSWVLATIVGGLPYYLSQTMVAQDRPITLIESLFESQSGFSTTGATVLTDLQDPELVPYCILFWRSSTHFLGGLGIVVLFVAILGQGSAGKAMMRAEMPGPTKEGSMPRMQHTALVFAAIYFGLNVILAVIYHFEGMTGFDSICHAFSTMSTGGFSTYNLSLGAFNSPAIEYTTIVFMIMGGTNFTLLYFTVIGHPLRLLRDVEFQTYIGIIVVVTLAIMFFGMRYGDPNFGNVHDAFRFGSFQVVSILTTTGYGTADFDVWNNFGRGALLLLMFIGGCAGSTGGGLKVIRHVLFVKILKLEIEQAHRPRVRRLLRVGGQPIEDPELTRNILVYFSLILAIFIPSWMCLITFEPDTTWGVTRDEAGRLTIATPAASTAADAVAIEREMIRSVLGEKLLDSASAVAATLNNTGPGLGVVGGTKNYAGFSQGAKLWFVWLMMLGRVEVFSILVLIFPGFWRRH